jgi:hypothetical protein
MSNQTAAANTAAAKNAVKKSAFKSRIEINKTWRESELSLNGVFKYLSKQKSDLKTWLSLLNLDLEKQGKQPLLIDDVNLSNFLDKIKSIEVTFKGEIKPYMNKDKKLFSPAFILRGFELISKS